MLSMGDASVPVINANSAFLDLILKLKKLPVLRGIITVLVGRDKAQLANQSGTLLNVESWWYLVFRTFNAEGAMLFASFCQDMGPAEWYYYDIDYILHRFIRFALSQQNWWETSYCDIINMFQEKSYLQYKRRVTPRLTSRALGIEQRV